MALSAGPIGFLRYPRFRSSWSANCDTGQSAARRYSRGVPKTNPLRHDVETGGLAWYPEAVRLTFLVLLLLTPACSLRRLAVNSLADALSSGADVFGTDDDPELVRDALPFGLKTIEALIVEDPENEGLLLAAARGFTQYSKAFVEEDADHLENVDYEAALREKERALKMHLRARDYGLRALALSQPDVGDRLRFEPALALAEFGPEATPILYWTGAAWGSAISLGLDRPEIAADIDAARELLRRALEVDESFGEGSVHEAMIIIESLPEMMGGSPERARGHHRRAIELSGGASASAHVLLAENVAIAAQDRGEFKRALDAALAVDLDLDPNRRLANIIAQRRARDLLDAADDLFLEPLE